MKEAKLIQCINLLINIVLCAVLGITGQIVTNSYSIIAFFQTYLLTLCVGFTAGTWIPANNWGQKLASKLDCKSEIGTYVITNVVTAVIMTTIIVFAATFIQAGTEFIQPFCILYPPFIVVASITTLISSNLIVKIAHKIVH